MNNLIDIIKSEFITRSLVGVGKAIDKKIADSNKVYELTKEEKENLQKIAKEYCRQMEELERKEKWEKFKENLIAGFFVFLIWGGIIWFIIKLLLS